MQPTRRWTLTVENDAVLPVQYLAGAKIRQPEHRLLLALLTDACNILYKSRVRDGRTMQHRAAETWMWIELGDVGHFPFDYTCEHLDLNPQSVRRAIRMGMERKIPATSVRRSEPYYAGIRIRGA